MDSTISAWAAEERSRVLSEELLEGKEKLHGGLVSAPKERENGTRKRSELFKPVKENALPKPIVETRWIHIWEMGEGKKDVQARLVAQGYRGLDLRDGLVETSGCVSVRPSHLQVRPSDALEKWNIWSPGIRKTCMRAAGFRRNVLLRDSAEWDPRGAHRIWKSQAPAHGLNDAPPASRKTL